MLPTLSPLVAPEIVTMTISSAPRDDKDNFTELSIFVDDIKICIGTQQTEI